MALLTHTAELGGAELAMTRLLEALPTSIQPIVISFGAGPLVDQVRALGHQVMVVPMGEQLRGRSRAQAGGALSAPAELADAARFAWTLRRTLHLLDVEVVHVASLKAYVLGAPVARTLGLPVVWQVHDRISSDYLPGVTVRALRNSARWVPTAVIANSASTAATVPRARRLTVVYPGLADDQFGPPAEDRVPPAPAVVGIVGRLSPTKGQHVFVDAAADLTRVFPEATFEVVGSAMFGHERYRDELIGQARRLGLADRIRFTGFVNDPRRAYDRMSVCVQASTVPEPFGQVTAEAMAWGVPVIASATGGATELLKPEGSVRLGSLVSPGDPLALATAIATVLRDPATARTRASHAQEHVRKHLGIARTAAGIDAVWQSVTRDGRHPDSPSAQD